MLARGAWRPGARVAAATGSPAAAATLPNIDPGSRWVAGSGPVGYSRPQALSWASGVVERPMSEPTWVASGTTLCRQASRMSEVFSLLGER